MTRFRRRVVGYVPHQGACHSQIELSADRRCLLFHLASTGRFSVAIAAAQAAKLLCSLDSREPAQVEVTQPDGKRQWLTVLPHDRSAELPVHARSNDTGMELALEAAPDQQLRLVFPGPALLDLRRHLTTAYLQLEMP
ncbi:hypothetical protein F4560_005049 [Saccharothrix ecbatanensis]|uniref:Uncharacterized protein n=1 Tax=Saccharothrix ecbatanensis TaxID=1105145 RepID=A0A7W9HNI9_9PSEU|nr:hypothetical protein [Saccharothrix ecbatanensis]